MPSELRAVGNYAVSNRTLQNHYKSAAAQYLHDSISEDRCYIEDPSYSAIINWNASDRNIDQAFKVIFSIPDAKNLGLSFP